MYIYIYMHVCVYIYIMCICIYVYIHIMYIYIYIYIYIYCRRRQSELYASHRAHLLVVTAMQNAWMHENIDYGWVIKIWIQANRCGLDSYTCHDGYKLVRQYLHTYLYTYTHTDLYTFVICDSHTYGSVSLPSWARSRVRSTASLSAKDLDVGRPILYTTTTTTTQRGWCIEAFVSILAHLQSQKLLPGCGVL